MSTASETPKYLEPPDRVKRCHLALTITRLFDHWGLHAGDQLALLGLSGNSHSTLSRYRRGNPVSPNRDMIERIGHLLGVHRSLETLFPDQPSAQRVWVLARKRSLGGYTPVDFIKKEGITGLRYLRSLTEAQCG